MLISLKYKIRPPPLLCPLSSNVFCSHPASSLSAPYSPADLVPHRAPSSIPSVTLPSAPSCLLERPFLWTKSGVFLNINCLVHQFPPPPLVSLQEWQVIPWSTLHRVIYIQIEVQKDWCVLPPWFVCLSFLFVPVQACILCSIRRSCSCVGPKCYRGALLLL